MMETEKARNRNWNRTSVRKEKIDSKNWDLILFLIRWIDLILRPKRKKTTLKILLQNRYQLQRGGSENGNHCAFLCRERSHVPIWFGWIGAVGCQNMDPKFCSSVVARRFVSLVELWNATPTIAFICLRLLTREALLQRYDEPFMFHRSVIFETGKSGNLVWTCDTGHFGLCLKFLTTLLGYSSEMFRRLVALSDESALGNPEVINLISLR